jgi:alkanesulfonate monooxygenase SsuD/methylene tetrahydromethanopterin reductase-like flavin-dependent oxidoreductase (luciferase family)
VTFHGEYFQYEDVTITPRPTRPIPIWIGGESEAAILRTAALGDGWLGGLTDPRAAGNVVVRIKAALNEAGRHIDGDHYGVVLPFRVDADAMEHPAVVDFRSRINARRRASAEETMIAVGAPAAVVSVFQQYIDAGISKFVAIPIGIDALDIQTQLQQLSDQIRPRIETVSGG